jgi:osmotically inducible protein OsmC
MALSNMLAGAGHVPTRVHTTARVTLERGESGFGISNIHLAVEAEVPGISPEEFRQKAEEAKTGCPISKALAATPITLESNLVSSA